MVFTALKSFEIEPCYVLTQLATNPTLVPTNKLFLPKDLRLSTLTSACAMLVGI